MGRSLAVSLLAFLAITGPIRAADPDAQVTAALIELARSAERIFRGSCVEAKAETLELAGGRIAVTRYTFEVREHLKGPSSSPSLTFLQVGSPSGGERDLGRLAGLPVYRTGTEFVLFLLPESRAGLTSPSGAGEAAFTVDRERLTAIPGGHGIRRLPPAADAGESAGAAGLAYGDLRRLLEER